MGKFRDRLWIGWSILAIGCAAVIGLLLSPTPAPWRTLPPGWDDRQDVLGNDSPPGELGAAGAVPPPPTPPSSAAPTAPTVGHFRAVGTVQSGEEGPKIAHAVVEVFSRWDDQEMAIGRGETDDTGRFAVELPTLDVLPPAARAQMSLFARARAAGHRSGRLAQVVQSDLSGMPRDVGADLVLVLIPGHDVIGRVVDEEGRAIAGARVTMSDGTPSIRVVAHADESGLFRFPVETAASVYFLAGLPGVGTGSLPPRTLTPDVEMVLPDLVLRRGADVAGVVVDRTGRPVAGVPVEASSLAAPSEGSAEWVGAPAGAADGSAMTDAAGRFRITGLFPGDLELDVVDGPQALHTPEPVRTGREDVRLVLAEQVVRVVVVDPAGAPVVGATWLVEAPDIVPARWRRGWVGTGAEALGFVLVPEGARVVASASLLGWTPAKAEAICAGPGTTDVVLRLAPAGAQGRVRFELTGAVAPRVVRLSVSFTLATGEQGGPSIERDAAPGEVLQIPPGRYRLEVLPRGEGTFETDFVLSTAEVTVPPGGEVRVPLPVRRGGGVRIALAWPADARGGVLEGIVATSLDREAAPTNLTWSQQRADGAGSTMSRGGFPIEAGSPIDLVSGGLPPGRWTFEIRVEGFEPARIVATIEEGKVAEERAVLVRKPK